MNEIQQNNRRIAKNTLLLYIRMILVLGVTLYTVRIILDALGVIDYGIYNVIGGIVIMFSFLSNTMASATQRFFAFELGKNNVSQLSKIFSTSMTIYFIFAIGIFFLAETVGLWFVNTQMTIPESRLTAANWAFQFSIFSFMASMFSIPYTSVIIAREKMKIYAYISIIEVILNLLVAYLIVFISTDKLKLYASLIFIIKTVIAICYRQYCKSKYKECKYHFCWDKQLFSKLSSYSGWMLFGASGIVIRNQGINILLNVFFNPVVNAARGIAMQIDTAINQFVLNFIKATYPQITKYYATNQIMEMKKLVLRSSKFSFFLLFTITLPLLFETQFILEIWLKEVPEYVVLFTRLTIIMTLIDSFSHSLMAAAQATGKIKKYQIIIGSALILNLPVTYIFLKIGFNPEIAYIIAINISIINLILRLLLLRQMIGLSIRDFVNHVLIKVSLPVIISLILPLYFFRNIDHGIFRIILISLSCITISISSIYFIGLTKNERTWIINMIKAKL
ncbi:lipopolysaccharide biosynthesis protein [Draconibacterium orientale]|uniref:lipopolysaccharide biosynthesis protein n=1 Tax=Draconibacterium orientale TaxID=1168034 RepID=UPI0029C0457F|nr:lipopolysaccharide biosynthesis protein [Draconibacterium orientale]